MTEIRFGRLTDLPLREAWKHEAHQFTPWLAENIDHLSDAIGIPLELTGTEVAVESFSADILARNPMDDSTVLIENQLEQTDHTHLGQIMTYLAGLEAQTVVWIAPSFREPHLSAIRWLNQHTADGFSFFAVKARVVRIGDSPFAPIFEVVEKPNDWERSVKQKKTTTDPTYDTKAQFWNDLLEKEPQLEALGVRRQRLSNNWVLLNSDPEINLSLYIGQTHTGAFLRGARGAVAEDVLGWLAPHRTMLEQRIGTPLEDSSKGHFMATSLPKGYQDEGNWPAMMQWLVQAEQTYRAAITSAFGKEQTQ